MLYTVADSISFFAAFCYEIGSTSVLGFGGNPVTGYALGVYHTK